MEVVAWGDGEESWNVDYQVIPGDTSRPEVWEDLDDRLLVPYRHENGSDLNIAAAGVDSSDQTTIVYNWVRPRVSRRIFALKGVAGPGRPVAKVSRRRTTKRNVDLVNVGVDDAKGLIYARLKIEEPGPGYCHFPMDRDIEYFEMLTAEKMITKFQRGFPKKEWVKTRARNEALDCRVYAYAALKLLNPVWTAAERRMKSKTRPKQKADGARRTKRSAHNPMLGSGDWGSRL
jgi:phage terminase large subunit GpA-like protein